MSCGGTAHQRDILSSVFLSFVLFWLPAIAIVVTGSVHVSQTFRTIVWAASLSTIGTSCLANAARCGRIHCYATGPFFLVMAIVSVLYGFNFIPLGQKGWQIIGGIVLVGAVTLSCLPELLFGKYRKERSAVQSSSRSSQ